MNRIALDNDTEHKLRHSELDRDRSRLAASASHCIQTESLGRYVGCHTDWLQRGADHRVWLVHSTRIGNRSTSFEHRF